MKIFIIDLESVETRYTCQWKNNIPEQLYHKALKKGFSSGIFWDYGPEKDVSINVDVAIIPIQGETISSSTSPGAFLNFSATNVYKSSQIIHMAKLFNSDVVEDGDKILITDTWNPGVIQLKYMCELLDKNVEISGIWHAGSYDPYDFLGRKIQDKRWSHNFERSLLHAIDKNYFATQFHIDLIKDQLKPELKPGEEKLIQSGQPHEEIIRALEPCRKKPEEKEDIILFPHRLAEEKQPEIFQDLAEQMPEYQWILCQEHNMTKSEYHQLLGRAKIVFSANLQETLGISAMEAVLAGAKPLLPNRLSYREMYEVEFLYPGYWTSSWSSYSIYRDFLVQRIRNTMDEFHKVPRQLEDTLKMQRDYLKKYYLTGTKMYENLLSQ